MKKIICGLCSLAIILCIGGCNKAVENGGDTSTDKQETEDNSVNIFNDKDSITVVSGNLSYSIPGSVKGQYDEKLMDVGFTISAFQSYDIPEFGKLSIYQANLFYDEDTWNLINDLGLTNAKLINNRADLNIFDQDKRYVFSSFNGIAVDDGIDLYIHTDEKNVEYLSLHGIEEQTGEKRFIYFIKGLSSYTIEFDFELGKYNKQIVDTFLDSIKFISLEDY